MKFIKKTTAISLIALSTLTVTGCDFHTETKTSTTIEILEPNNYEKAFELAESKLSEPAVSEFMFTHTLLLKSINHYAIQREFDQRVFDAIPVALSLELHGMTTDYIVENADSIAANIYERLEIYNLASKEQEKITVKERGKQIEQLGSEFSTEPESDDFSEVVIEEIEESARLDEVAEGSI